MKRSFTAIAICLLAFTALATSENKHEKKTEERRSVTLVLNRTVVNLENELVPAADAMPEDKYSFAPTEGEFKNARTYAQQIKHIAAVNYELAAAILDERAPIEINDEAGPASITSKADIMKYLKDSFVYVHRALDTINEQNLTATVKSPFGEGAVTRLGLATSVSWHGFDHYGQMVVYLRMNGIVPPASR